MTQGFNFDEMSKGDLVKELESLYCSKSDIIKHHSICAPHFRSMIKNRNQEHFMVLYLDKNKKIIEKKVVFLGTLNRSLVHPRETFHSAVVNNCPFIVIGHNHPSGNIQPSLEDIEMTRKLEKGGQILGVKVLDHVIITDTGHYSFKANGKISTNEV